MTFNLFKQDINVIESGNRICVNAKYTFRSGKIII